MTIAWAPRVPPSHGDNLRNDNVLGLGVETSLENARQAVLGQLEGEAQQPDRRPDDAGAVAGRRSPADAGIRILARLASLRNWDFRRLSNAEALAVNPVQLVTFKPEYHPPADWDRQQAKRAAAKAAQTSYNWQPKWRSVMVARVERSAVSSRLAEFPREFPRSPLPC